MILKVGKVKKNLMEVKCPHLIQTGKMLVPCMEVLQFLKMSIYPLKIIHFIYSHFLIIKNKTSTNTHMWVFVEYVFQVSWDLKSE